MDAAEKRAMRCSQILGELSVMGVITNEEWVTIRNRTIVTHPTYVPIKE